MVEKMPPRRKREKPRTTLFCFYMCLIKEEFRHMLRWKNREEGIFSILFKHKKSPTWEPKFLDVFKTLDNLSPKKGEKYANEDSDLGCKRRCKANLRKLCIDGVLQFIKEKEIDKCTKIKYYKFLEIPNLSDDEKWPFMNMQDGKSIYKDDNYNEELQNTPKENTMENYNSHLHENTESIYGTTKPYFGTTEPVYEATEPVYKANENMKNEYLKVPGENIPSIENYNSKNESAMLRNFSVIEEVILESGNYEMCGGQNEEMYVPNMPFLCPMEDEDNLYSEGSYDSESSFSFSSNLPMGENKYGFKYFAETGMIA